MDSYPIEKQVCTLEQAKKLAELLGENAPGSLWIWAIEVDIWGENPVYILNTESHIDDNPSNFPPEPMFKAYTAAELGALLPFYMDAEIKHGQFPIIVSYGIKIEHWNDIWTAKYEEREDVVFTECDSATEAHAKADLLIKLLKDKIIKPEDVSYDSN